MQAIKKIKKGEYLFKEGESATKVFLIQSGRIELFLERPKNNINLFILSTSQFVGLQALSKNKYDCSAKATLDATIVEMPIEVIKKQIESQPQLLKLLTSSLNEQLSQSNKLVKSLKSEKDNSPCPANLVPKIFGLIHLLGKQHGSQPEGTNELIVDWKTYKDYGYKMFNEEPERIRKALEIGQKLNFCSFIFEVPEEQKHDKEANEQLSKIHFTDINAFSLFADYYQHYFYKSGQGGLLCIDETSKKILVELLNFSKDIELSRFNTKKIDYPGFVAHFKEKQKISLTSNQWKLLEQKGVFVKQQQTDEGVFVEYDFDEITSIANHWSFLTEIGSWNEKGFIDLSIPEDDKSNDEGACPECEKPVDIGVNFCPSCGFSMKKAA